MKVDIINSSQKCLLTITLAGSHAFVTDLSIGWLLQMNGIHFSTAFVADKSDVSYTT